MSKAMLVMTHENIKAPGTLLRAHGGYQLSAPPGIAGIHKYPQKVKVRFAYDSR